MPPKLYSTLASWWHLLSDPQDYAEEVACYWRLLCERASRPVGTMLELGCGGGNNAFHFKQHCQLTLTDLSPDMLTQSRRINPECEHFEGDMRTLQLSRRFDAVFVHDAVMYMVNEGDLRQAIKTAVTHCEPGGIVMFVADCTRETWAPSTSHGGHDGDGRALRYLEWTWDPDPADTEFVAEMVYMLREGDQPVRIERDRHRFGLFSSETWIRLLAESGVRASKECCRFVDGEEVTVFVGVLDSYRLANSRLAVTRRSPSTSTSPSRSD